MRASCILTGILVVIAAAVIFSEQTQKPSCVAPMSQARTVIV